MSRYLRPTAEVAPNALLPGDPGRALALAQDLLVKPLMSNHNRGLWGYRGRTADGLELTIQSTGVGGPSAAIVLEELASLGLRRAIRLGSCTGLAPGLGAGDRVLVQRALAADGSSRALGAVGDVRPDRRLTEALGLALTGRARSGRVATVDLLYDPRAERRDGDLLAAGAIAVELAAAPLFALGSRLGLAVAGALVVDGPGDDVVAAPMAELGRAAAGALAALDREAGAASAQRPSPGTASVS